MPLHPHGGPAIDVKSAMLDSDGWQRCRALVNGVGLDPGGLPAVPNVITGQRTVGSGQ